uniref:Sterol methyltransferase-like 3 n=1 Tax=Botryococcus braunii TaxID=38881 RepID=SMTL3_BOTBR|nr:RecName: Full=Sterol methyltransferase-like 3 [Botryococcus braunii]AEY68261.1 sterol methyltransferase-like 3 [Botryococcus braunii]
MVSELVSMYVPPIVEAAKAVTPWQAAAGVTAAIFIGSYLWHSASLRKQRRTGTADGGLFSLTAGGIKKQDVTKLVDSFSQAYKTEDDGQLTCHHITREQSVEMVNTFYDLITDLYEWAWDTSFHFSCRPRWANFAQAQVLHEWRIANLANIQPGMKVLDVGTGVGNPGRTIASLSGAQVTGVTINAYQVKRALHHTRKAKLEDFYKPVQADFTDTPFEDDTFDAAFAIEATCHAPKLEQVYKEVYRVLKPGAYFALYDGVTKPNFDPKNERHVQLMNATVIGNGCPDMRTWKECEEIGKEVGFKLHMSYDAGEASRVLHPWWEKLDNFINTGFAWYGPASIKLLSKIGFLPRDFTKFIDIAAASVFSVKEAGELGIFTPMYVFVWQKPEKTA